MDSIKIVTGEKRIAINDDPNRVIVFNPSDVTFAERFYSLLGEFEAKLSEYEKRAEAIDKITAVDERGIPVNLNERIAFLRETCDYLRERVDHLFGAGTAQTAFGDALTLDMFTQFFDGITQYLQPARAAKIEKYLPPSTGKKRKRVVK